MSTLLPRDTPDLLQACTPVYSRSFASKKAKDLVHKSWQITHNYQSTHLQPAVPWGPPPPGSCGRAACSRSQQHARSTCTMLSFTVKGLFWLAHSSWIVCQLTGGMADPAPGSIVQYNDEGNKTLTWIDCHGPVGGWTLLLGLLYSIMMRGTKLFSG